MNENQARLQWAARLEAGDWDKICAGSEFLMREHQFGCSEALLLAFQEILGEAIVPPVAIAMSSAFRGGMGGAGCVCGALAAAQMLLGSFLGYYGTAANSQTAASVQKSREVYKELHDTFLERHGSTCCRLLTEGLHQASERKTKCAALTRSAAVIVSGLLARQASGKS